MGPTRVFFLGGSTTASRYPELTVNLLNERGIPTMFYCGNDAGAKAAVAKILEQFGWEPADMGTAVAARALEPLCQLWCIPGFLRNQWTHAFAVFWR